ncbi:hypothetical protein J6U76_01620 [bacterium]|nr:hypothetical protein [bacterium]
MIVDAGDGPEEVQDADEVVEEDERAVVDGVQIGKEGERVRGEPGGVVVAGLLGEGGSLGGADVVEVEVDAAFGGDGAAAGFAVFFEIAGGGVGAGGLGGGRGTVAGRLCGGGGVAPGRLGGGSGDGAGGLVGGGEKRHLSGCRGGEKERQGREQRSSEVAYEAGWMGGIHGKGAGDAKVERRVMEPAVARGGTRLGGGHTEP